MSMIILVVLAFILVVVVPNWFYNLDVRETDYPEDLTIIKMKYEGLQGAAGPNMTAVSIVRCGTTIGLQLGRGRNPPRRRYRIVLRSVDGRERTKIVSVLPPDDVLEHKREGL